MHSSNNNQLPVKRLKSKLFPGSEPTYPEPLKIYSKINSGRIWNSSQYDALPELSSYMPFKVKVDYPIPKAHSPQPKARDKMPPIITNEIISNLSRNNEMYKESRVIKLPKRAMTPIQKLPLPIQEPRITSEIGAVYLTHENNRSYIKKIPIEIAYLSPTLKHIHKSSEPFLEGHQGFISLSLTSRSAFIDILAYMDHLWDPKSKSYIVNPECAVELIDHAFYLELPGLVDLSATCIANNADLNLLKNIPTLLIEVVLKKMNIINLFIAEQRYY